AEAMLADSPVTAYAIKQAAGQLAAVGKMYDSAPYGIAIAKGAGTLRDAVHDALKALIADGTYGKILDKWGLAAGAITEPAINGAQSGAGKPSPRPGRPPRAGRTRRARRSRSRRCRSATPVGGWRSRSSAWWPRCWCMVRSPTSGSAGTRSAPTCS